MKSWRCDLTALSQLYNFYFVACNDNILVYQPGFPDQTFDPKPKLVLQPPTTSPYLEPGIDDEDPHSITRILVESLGHEEILLATCDDGDCFAYRIESIRRALSELSESEESQEIGLGVPLLFHQNVGASAWGLAVHREARIIAISANTHEVTIVAFALASQESEQIEPDLMDSRSIAGEEADPSDFPSPRKHDHFFTLKANHNVPSVSFNNNDEDPAGRWLFGTCITGEVWLWDLHNLSTIPCRIFEMGFCASAQLADRAPQVPFASCRCANKHTHPHASWGAMFLDPRSAHEIPSLSDPPQSARRAPYFHDAGTQKVRFRLLTRLSTVLNNTTSDGTDGEMAVSDGGSDSDEGSDTTDDYMSIDNADDLDEAAYDEEQDDMQDHEDDVNTYNGPPIPSMQLSAAQPDSNTVPWSAAHMANLLASGAPWSILTQAIYAEVNDTEEDDNNYITHTVDGSTFSNNSTFHSALNPYCEVADSQFPTSEVCTHLRCHCATILI